MDNGPWEGGGTLALLVRTLGRTVNKHGQLTTFISIRQPVNGALFMRSTIMKELKYGLCQSLA
jgi:hypothetical protein